MATHRFRILNVFTDGSSPLSGNPLCVFEDGSAFDTAAMQALARQFNLSETTFVLPSASAAARVRIFTPSYEMPFAGHPTLGTAQVCRALGLGGDSLRLEMTAGLIEVRAAANRWTLTAPPVRSREFPGDPGELAHALGLEPADLGGRPLLVAAGKEQLIVPLTSEAAVRRARPRPGSPALTSADGDAMAYVFARTAPGRALARFFFSQGPAMLEDPATGSATANLGGWHLAMGEPLPVRLTISQGEQVERPSRLHLEVDAGGEIRVGGEVVEIAQGTLEW